MFNRNPYLKHQANLDNFAHGFISGYYCKIVIDIYEDTSKLPQQNLVAPIQSTLTYILAGARRTDSYLAGYLTGYIAEAFINKNVPDFENQFGHVQRLNTLSR